MFLWSELSFAAGAGDTHVPVINSFKGTFKTTSIFLQKPPCKHRSSRSPQVHKMQVLSGVLLTGCTEAVWAAAMWTDWEQMAWER